VDEEEYGVDLEGLTEEQLQQPEDDVSEVTVPPTNCPLPADQLQHLNKHIDPLHYDADDPNGFDIYAEVPAYLV
jgi:hypothetical protein